MRCVSILPPKEHHADISFLTAVTWLALCPAAAFTQTADELVNDGKNPANVTTQSMGYDRKSYSPLKQINNRT